MAMRRRQRGQRRGGAYPRRIARFVEPALLLLLRQSPSHGYGLMEGLKGLGFEDYPVDFSAVYRTLRSLEEAGMVGSDWDLKVSAGPPRRVYTITPDGEAHLALWVDDLRATDRVLHAFLDAYAREYADPGSS
jgi:poly-beta-hydroxybutyrate-responsive repressor